MRRERGQRHRDDYFFAFFPASTECTDDTAIPNRRLIARNPKPCFFKCQNLTSAFVQRFWPIEPNTCA